jgi:ATP-dependent Zn protease
MSNILILLAVAYGVYKFKKAKFNLGSLDNSLDFLSKKFKAIEPQNIKIHFKDVAGMHEAKF